ncbi:MAG: hypothetical protein CMI95_05240 [Pelagibacteraceae bacterium]|nr:hypothetical protein [Pelagibacteraceae bacterium]
MHKPVLLDEAIKFIPKKNKLNIIDATYGGGGYSKKILKLKNLNQLIAIDRDPEVNYFAKLNNYKKFKFIEGNFSQIDKIIKSYQLKKKLLGFDAIIFDLGISSNQLNDSRRGFSFDIEGPLDMRMNQKLGISAYDLVNTFNEKEIANIIFKYGEERFAKKIAKEIVNYRKKSLIKTTYELASIIKSKINKLSKKNPATKTFQALRIFVNNELNDFKEALTKSEKLLLPGGRIIVVSFHSLEDRLVKDFFNHKSGKRWRSSRHFPEYADTGSSTLKLITKKVIRPDEKELSTNPRSRSAKLRVAEKLGKLNEN